MLRPAGYEVAMFPTDKAFLESLTHKRPDVVIVELNMPGRSGLDIVSRLRAEQIVVPTLMMTGGSDPDLERRALQSGVRTILRLPLLDDLLAAVESALHSRVA